MGVSMEMDGMDDLQRYFAKTNRSIAEREPVIKAMEYAGDLIAFDAQRRIRDDDGTLAENIKVDTTKAKSVIRVKVHTGKARHGSPLEHGHAPSGWNKGTKDVLPQPFMWPAYEARKGDAYDLIKGAVSAVVRKEDGG